MKNKTKKQFEKCNRKQDSSSDRCDGHTNVTEKNDREAGNQFRVRLQ